MGIKKLLLQSNIDIDGVIYDVLIPLPANRDQCLIDIGIDDFDDGCDDDWDIDFINIVMKLIGKKEYTIEFYNRNSNETELIPEAMLSDIQGYLAHNDHGDFIIKTDSKEIRFTLGHEIFWLTGFSEDKIKSIGYSVVPYKNSKIKNIF